MHKFSQAQPLFKGFVGARTTLSGGQSSAAEYAKAAREKGLGFVIVLENGPQMTAEKMEQLKKECTAASSNDLLMIPGFRFATNLGVSFFVYGENLALPSADMASKIVPGTIKLQGESPDGKWRSDDKFLLYVFLNWEKNTTDGIMPLNVGFYDFKKSAEAGAFFKPEYARISSAVGVKFYREGKLIEDMTREYLRVNAGTYPVLPMAVNLVDSTQKWQPRWVVEMR